MSIDLDAITAELNAIEDWETREARQFELVRNHGAAIARVTFGRYADKTVRFYDPIETPEASPWTFESNSAADVINTVWAPLAKELPSFLRALNEACVTIMVRNDGDDWRLLYFLERTRPDAMCVKFPGGSNRYSTKMGGAPNANAGKNLPAQVRDFMSIHDGFGDSMSDFGVECILPDRMIAPLRDDMPNMLELYCDSVGNRRLIPIERLDESIVCDWDHETGEFAEAMPFFDWVNTRVAVGLLDLDAWDYPNGV